MQVEAQPMRIRINGREDFVAVEPGSRLGEVVREVRSWLLSQRIAVLAMRLDGKLVPGELDSKLEEQLAEDFGALEVDASPVEVLARETLQSLMDHLPILSERLVEITAQLQMGNVQNALTRLDDVLEAWRIFLSAVDDLRRLLSICRIGLADLDMLLAPREKKLQSLLKEIRSAIQDRDLVTLGDCLEYELAPSVTGWAEVLEGLGGAVGRAEEEMRGRHGGNGSAG